MPATTERRTQRFASGDEPASRRDRHPHALAAQQGRTGGNEHGPSPYSSFRVQWSGLLGRDSGRRSREWETAINKSSRRLLRIMPMSKPGLAAFHETSRKLDFIGPLESLLNEFRCGNIADRNRVQEALAIQSYFGEHHEAWDRVFPTFPECPWKRRTITSECHRGRRDAYLKRLIVTHVPEHEAASRLIINPIAVLGRHARSLARELPAYEVVGSDIDPWWDRIHRLVSLWKYHKPRNYRFVRENIFEPDLGRRPAAIVFFGACGSVTDGCMDYAIAVNSPFLICRSCCHENIGGNTEIVRRPGHPINDFFAWKNPGNHGLRHHYRRRPEFAGE